MNPAHIPPLQRQALLAALAAPTHTLRRMRGGYVALDADVRTSGAATAHVFTGRLMNMLWRNNLVDFDQPDFPPHRHPQRPRQGRRRAAARARMREGGCGVSRHGNGCISVSVCTEIDTDVDVEIDDIIASASPEDLKKLAARIGNDASPNVCTGVGDPPPSRYVERAYLAALRITDLPREIADLFWHVHGRAL